MKTRRRLWYVMALCGLLLTGTGCPLILIGAGVAGGYAIGKDSATATLERGFDAVWSVIRQEVEKMATITTENKALGTMEARTPDDTKVWVTLERPTNTSVSLTIKARKNLMPRVKVAQDIMEKVLKRF